MNIAPDWDRIRTFYCDLIASHGTGLTPMLGIVEHFANLNTKYAIFPYTSHAALGLSTAPTHEGRLQCRNVFVAYGDETFTILYQSEFGKTRTFDDRVDPSSAEITLKIVDWLGYDSASG